MINEAIKKRTLILYFLTSVLAGFFAIYALFSTGSESEHVFFFGLSKIRFVFFCFFFINNYFTVVFVNIFKKIGYSLFKNQSLHKGIFNRTEKTYSCRICSFTGFDHRSYPDSFCDQDHPLRLCSLFRFTEPSLFHFACHWAAPFSSSALDKHSHLTNFNIYHCAAY